MTSAVHEAAHAVVALSLDLPLNSVTLQRPATGDSVDDGEGVEDDNEYGSLLGSIGLSLPADYSEKRYPELARGQIVTALAGPLAEIRHSGVLDVIGAAGVLATRPHLHEHDRGGGATPTASRVRARAREKKPPRP
jgi:hypothetical protein